MSAMYEDELTAEGPGGESDRFLGGLLGGLFGGESSGEVHQHEATEGAGETGFGEAGPEAGLEGALEAPFGEEELGEVGYETGLESPFGEAGYENGLESPFGEAGEAAEGGMEAGLEGALEAPLGEEELGEAGYEMGLETGLESPFGEAGHENGVGEGGLEAPFGETLGEGGLEAGLETGEQFIGSLFRQFAQQALPALQRVLPPALSTIASAVGGAEEAGLEATELELPEITESEHEQEVSAALSEQEAIAELMGAMAAGAQSEHEALTAMGAAVLSRLSARERRELGDVLAHLIRASAIITRVLRRRRATRPYVRIVPSVAHATARTLVRARAAGRPVDRVVAARVMTTHARHLLGNPRLAARALQRNVVVTRRVTRVADRPLPRSRARRVV